MSRPRFRLSPGAVFRRGLHRLDLLSGGIDWKRFVLDADVLRETLPLRASAARGRSSLPEAVDREARFEKVAERYRETLDDDGDVDGHCRRTAIDGIAWWVPLMDPTDEAAVARSLAHQDFPYRAITQTRELAVGGIMLDIGANNGRMSISRVMLGDVRVAYCAEPEPLNYACLVRNVRDNGLRGLVLPDRVAIGSDNTTVLMMRGRTSGGHRVVNPGSRQKRPTIEVPCLTLDTWCERMGIDLQQVSFVKVDTQGSEIHVLRGAPRVLACRHIAWQIEIDPGLLRNRGFAPGDLFALMQRHFTHWIDLNRHAQGARVRAIHALTSALEYIQERRGARTDVLAFTLQAPSVAPQEHDASA
jgi:FkbM family methyltransferase